MTALIFDTETTGIGSDGSSGRGQHGTLRWIQLSHTRRTDRSQSMHCRRSSDDTGF